MIDLRDARRRPRLLGAILTIGGILLIIIVVEVLGTRQAQDTPIASTPDLSSHPTYCGYDFGPQDALIIGFGIQPLGVPIGVLSEAMKRDVVLRNALSDQGMELRFYPFPKGADLNFFLHRGDLEVALGGDMPALTACANTGVVVAALSKQGFTSIIARESMMMEELRGKRIGYPFGSNAHYALLQALSSAGLEEADVRMIRLNVSEMPDALAKGEIDAFAAWEPVSSIALARFDDLVVIRRSLSTSYLYFSRAFADQHPEPTRQVVAAQIRAMMWMRQQEENLLIASRWALQAGQELTGQQPVLTEEEYATLVKSDLLDVSPVAAIPENDLAPSGRLFREFRFLQRLERIPDAVDWDQVGSCFDLALLEEVLSDDQEYQLDIFKYEGSGS